MERLPEKRKGVNVLRTTQLDAWLLPAAEYEKGLKQLHFVKKLFKMI
jgi:hypothetical protein